MRNYSYEALSQQFQQLAGLTINEKKICKSFRDSDRSIEKSQKMVKLYTANLDLANDIAEKINKSFSDLKNDFATGKINRVRYAEYLKKCQGYFNAADLNLNEVPKVLKAKEILTEMKKYL